MVEQQENSQAISPLQWAQWLDQIKAIGGVDPLVHFEPDESAYLNLERTHPGGQAQLMAGRPTLLSNLVRDAGAYASSIATARRIKAKSDRLSEHFGLESIHVAGGLVDMTVDGFDAKLPILLWPVLMIGRGGDDFEFTLNQNPEVNPALVTALAKNYGVNLDVAEVLRRQSLSSQLLPADVLTLLGSHLVGRGGAKAVGGLVIGNFTTMLARLVDDFSEQSNDLIVALANGAPAEGARTGAARTVDATVPAATEPILVADADSTQQRIVARAVAGESFAVETLPGSGYTQTVVNALAGLVNAGKRVLLVAPRRQTLVELADRLATLGLNGLALRSTDAWVDAIGAISRNEKSIGIDGEALNRRATQAEGLGRAEADIEEYFATLNGKNELLGVSVAEALGKLSELSGMPHAPVTSARLDRDHLVELADRTEALELLQQAHDLGEFNFNANDTGWFQARFENAEQVQQTIALASRLHQDAYPRLSAQLAEFTRGVNFAPAATVEDWGRYLRLFIGIRETLDRFQAVVFDRPLTELIIATGPRRPGDDDSSLGAEVDAAGAAGKMSGGNRRRLKKLAKEYLRPGMTVSDMHASLRAIAQQREEWMRFCAIPTPPQVPLGIADAQVAYQSFVGDLERIQQHLDPDANEDSLTRMPLELLAQRLDSLANQTNSLDNLGDRLVITDRLRGLGLGQLVRDLARIKVSREHLAQELEQAWWQSALEYLVGKNPKLLSFGSNELARLEQRFREMDAALVATGSPLIAAALAKRWSAAIASGSTEAEALKALLRTGHATIAGLRAAAPAIWPTLAPAVLVSQFELPAHIERDAQFDAVFILDAAGTGLVENLGALRRANQVIAWGDDAIAAPAAFEVVPRGSAISTGNFKSEPSIFKLVGDAFGIETMRHSWRTTGQTLGELINREFYQNRIVFEPTANEFMNEHTIALSLVRSDNRAVSLADDATESLDGEVARVVELVTHHAKWHPQDSLLVASASALHAERIRVAVQAAIAHSADLATFFEGHGRERFEVSSMADLTHRIADRVIFSIGFGLTPHGAVLSNFGQLQDEDGRRYLANLLVSSRREITIVSCFDASAMPADQLKNGALLLRDLLLSAQNPTAEQGEFDRDPMLADLAIRLQKLGVRVNAAFAERLPLVCSYAKTSVVIEPDWALRGDTYSEKLRLRPALLAALGWRYVRVHSFELFADPQAVATRIAESMGVQVQRGAVSDRKDDVAFEDTDLAWGDHRSGSSGGDTGNDRRLRDDVPPHWG